MVQRLPDPPPAISTRGFARIPRVGEGQERIEIDGASRGFTPAVVELAVGSHRVVVRNADTGTPLLERDIAIGAEHTRVAPAVVRR